MFTDLYTVMWKEWKEIVVQRPSLRGGWVGLLLMIGVFGVFVPLNAGPRWLTSPFNLVVWGWVPFLLISSVVADSFAGERERHTLETLLSSRLSDRSILLAKIVAALVYGWGLTLICLVLSLLTINLAFGKGQFLMYSPGMLVGAIGLSFLISLFSAALGVLVSLRSSTVRQAQQGFTIAMLVFLVPMLIFPMLPIGIRESVAGFLARANLAAIGIAFGSVLLLVDVGLMAAAMARFQRSRLILD